MSLKKALDDCLVDFDRRVLVTDLLEQYKLTYKEVHEALEAHIKQQESSAGTKFEKRYLVHGTSPKSGDDEDAPSEIYTVVQGESKLKEWLRKLQNAQSSLYSVEVAGGSKAPAQIFKPMQHLAVQLEKLERRVGVATAAPTAPVSNGGVKSEVAVKAEPSRQSTSSKVEAAPAEKKKQSPTEQKKGKGAANNKQGNINSFFGAGAAAKPTPAKDNKAAEKPAASSMQNFFKKQPDKAKKSPPKVKEEQPKPKEEPANTSVQLFEEESASSDEEEKLDKLRSKIVVSDRESDSEDVKPSTSKRRRIVDSDDEEQPQKKSIEPKQQDVEMTDVEEVAEAPTNETFLDEDGFVITIKPKKQSQPAKKKASPPAAKKKTPPTASKNSSAAKTSATPTASKTKQGNIMSFFSKK